jgi:hypothetical protein
MAGVVEGVRDLRVGVVIEKSVEQGESVGVGLMRLPRLERERHGDAGGLPALEPDVEVDDLGPVDGDVLDEEPDHAFAFPLRCRWVRPDCGEVGGERADLGLVLVAEGRRGLGRPVAVVLCVAELAEGVVPVGFESVGDEAVVGVDAEIAAAGDIGVVSGSFHVGVAETAGFVRSGFDFGLDAEGDFEGNGGEGVEHERGDGVVDPGTRDSQAR